MNVGQGFQEQTLKTSGGTKDKSNFSVNIVNC
jgi:hypothetical protein